MKKKIIFLIIALFLVMYRVSALTFSGCDYSTVSRYKSLITNVNIAYDYRIVSGRTYFDVTLTNITPGMYFRDSETGKIYTYNNTSNGEITIKNYTGVSGSYKFYFTTSGCNDIMIGTKYYKFPIYNSNYNDPLCSDIPNYSLCQKWIKNNLNYNDFKKSILKYKQSLEEKPEEIEPEQISKGFFDIIIDFYVRYYYLLLPMLIIICIIIMVNKNKKNKFDL